MYDSWLDHFIKDDAWRIKVVCSIAGSILLCIGLWYIIVYRSVVRAQVIDMSWELQIERLKYTTVAESDWYIPSGGRLDHTNIEIRSYETYISGWHYATQKGSTYSCGTKKSPKTCKYPDTKVRVNEYSTRPIWDTKYYYYIDRWLNMPPLVTSGKNKEDVAWPNTTDETYNDSNNVGNIKLGMRKSHFQVIMICNGKTYPLDMVEGMWREYSRGSNAKLTLGFFGNVLAVEKDNTW